MPHTVDSEPGSWTSAIREQVRQRIQENAIFITDVVDEEEDANQMSTPETRRPAKRSRVRKEIQGLPTSPSLSDSPIETPSSSPRAPQTYETVYEAADAIYAVDKTWKGFKNACGSNRLLRNHKNEWKALFESCSGKRIKKRKK